MIFLNLEKLPLHPAPVLQNFTSIQYNLDDLFAPYRVNWVSPRQRLTWSGNPRTLLCRCPVHACSRRPQQFVPPCTGASKSKAWDSIVGQIVSPLSTNWCTAASAYLAIMILSRQHRVGEVPCCCSRNSLVDMGHLNTFWVDKGGSKSAASSWHWEM